MQIFASMKLGGTAKVLTLKVPPSALCQSCTWLGFSVPVGKRWRVTLGRRVGVRKGRRPPKAFF